MSSVSASLRRGLDLGTSGLRARPIRRVGRRRRSDMSRQNADQCRRSGVLRGSATATVGRTERPGDHAGEAALGSAELFGERDDDAIGTAEVAEPVEILVLRHLADELGTMSPHAGYDVVDVVDSEHDAT
jgi:hypothetical protein